MVFATHSNLHWCHQFLVETTETIVETSWWTAETMQWRLVETTADGDWWRLWRPQGLVETVETSGDCRD